MPATASAASQRGLRWRAFIQRGGSVSPGLQCIALTLGAVGCTSQESGVCSDPYAQRMVDEEGVVLLGQHGGYGAENLPDVVLGPPQGAGPDQGGSDVLSLGLGGVVTLAFAGVITDGPGDDLIVYENAFLIGGQEDAPFHELAEVSVRDLERGWVTFACDESGFPYQGCAGWRPVQRAEGESEPLPEELGGDAFDLQAVGVREADQLRIRDLATRPEQEAPKAGFDLDAVAALHQQECRD